MGFDVCRHLKKNDELASIPVIMVTQRTQEKDRILELELRADDYVTYRFSVR